MTRRAKEKRASRIAEKIENKMEASWIKDAKAQWEELRHEVISGESTDTETSCDDPSTYVVVSYIRKDHTANTCRHAQWCDMEKFSPDDCCIGSV